MGSARIGLKSGYYALQTSDVSGGASTYGAMKPLADLKSAKITTKQDISVEWTDDTAGEIVTVNGEVEVEVSQKYISIDDQASILGHTITGGVMVKNYLDVPPYLGLAFMSRKANGNYQLIKLLKGKFGEPDHESETLSDKASPKYPSLKGTFVPRLCDGNTVKLADQDSLTYNSTIGTNWFTSFETADAVAPVVSTIVPAAGATAISKATTITWTMSKALDPSTVNMMNFYLVNDSTGALVPCTIAYNPSTFVVTLTPVSALSGTTKHMAVADMDVRDLSGNALAYAASYFTTVA
ncbi:MAG: major tail protein [Clostridia bacterium]|jgi:phi13 family phage major tail protein